ncbi:hypothetical protein DXC97_06240 [Lachnospiraceae bacterium TF09-5]|nr:hypothetical protein DXC97_06240 [Lachnospiraceae bacterium TF09-5]
MACSCIFPFIYCIGVKRIMCMESVTVHSQLPLLHAVPLSFGCPPACRVLYLSGGVPYGASAADKKRGCF